MKHIGLVLAALIVGAACSPAKSSTAPPTSTVAVATDATTTAPLPTTTTTVAVDPNVPPAVIDLPYLTAVMAKLNLLDLQQLAILERDRKVTPEVLALLRAEYAEPELDNQLTSAGEFFIGPSPNLRPFDQRGPVITKPTRILTHTTQCISFLATEDFSQEAATAVPIRTDLVVLKPISRAKDPGHLNPTPWQVGYTIIPANADHPSSGEDQCAA
jgi:hypothetical protein